MKKWTKRIILLVLIIAVLFLYADFKLRFMFIIHSRPIAQQYEYDYKRSFGTYTKVNVAQLQSTENKYNIILHNKSLLPIQRRISSTITIDPNRPVSLTWLVVNKRERHVIGFLTEPEVSELIVMNEDGQALTVTFITENGMTTTSPIADAKPLFWYIPNVTQYFKLIGKNESGAIQFEMNFVRH